MSVICPICVSPTLRCQVDADVVRKLSLKELSHKYRLSSRVVLHHIKHLPELLESEAAASKLSVYIGSVNYNVSVFVLPSEEEETAVDQGQPVGEEEVLLGHA
jgi:hypothetical protein